MTPFLDRSADKTGTYSPAGPGKGKCAPIDPSGEMVTPCSPICCLALIVGQYIASVSAIRARHLFSCLLEPNLHLCCRILAGSTGRKRSDDRGRYLKSKHRKVHSYPVFPCDMSARSATPRSKPWWKRHSDARSSSGIAADRKVGIDHRAGINYLEINSRRPLLPPFCDFHMFRWYLLKDCMRVFKAPATRCISDLSPLIFRARESRSSMTCSM
jgi:hypothetical protein